MAQNKLITVEVAYAKPDVQRILTLEVAAGSTIQAAIMSSGILDLFPEINLANQPVGIFSKPRLLSDTVQDGDRIELYRPLLVDPKVRRRAKAKKKK